MKTDEEDKVISYIKKSRLFKLLEKWASKIVPPGFEGVNLYETGKFFYHGIDKGLLPTRASAMAFSFFCAIFPSIIFLFTLIPYIPIHNFQLQLLILIKNVMPPASFNAVEETLVDIVTKQNGKLLSVGFITALYFSTNGFNSMITAFNTSYHVLETRKPMQQRLVSLVLVFIFAFLLTFAIGLIVGSDYITKLIIPKSHWAFYLIKSTHWIILTALLFCVISFCFYLGPATKVGWKFVSAGSTLATILCVITSLAFGYYVSHFGKYNKVYGSIGTLLIVLMWIYLNCLVLLIGFEFNAGIHSAKRKKTISV
ncbi:MAG TPA: YihY/virulence factor BrkB family protein [Bacteroidia bacterium]|jgi:membrane protein|nr:YihY/virulence factor BrkB family protein [Bacteroidia bacterium]